MEIAAGIQQPFPNFVYHLLIYILSFLSLEFAPLFLASALVSAIAVAAKFFISHKYIEEYVSGTLSLSNFREDKSFRKIVISLSVMLIFVFSLPITVLLGGDFYLLNFPPNVWHNPTTILLMPFAIFLFWISYKQLDKPSSQRITAIALLCIINILVKPSFFFVFCVIYPLFFLFKHGFKIEFWKNMLPIIIGFVLVYFEYYILYAGTDSSSGIAIGIFTVWSHYSPNIPLAFLGSIFLPLVNFAFYWRSLLKNLLFKYSVSLLALAVVVFSVLIETGSRKYHGNFAWQYIVANYILYMVIITLFVKRIYQSNLIKNTTIPKLLLQLQWQDKVILSVFAFQFLLGIFYFIRFYFKLGY